MPPQPDYSTVQRVVALAVLFAAARVAVLDHPVPVHGDDERFAYGVAYFSQHVLGTPPMPGDVAPPSAYPVQHPGYPLWIALGALLHVAGLRTYAALTSLSILASICEPLLFYRLAARRMSDAAAWWLAAAYGLSPIYWFCSVTALNYVPGSALGLLIVWLVWPKDDLDSNARRRRAWAATIVCAVGVGIRLDLLAWFGPLLLWTSTRRKYPPIPPLSKGGLGGVGWVAALVAAAALWWAAAGALYASAPTTQPAPSLQHTIGKVLATSTFRLGLVDGLGRNAVKLGAYLLWTLGLACLPLALFLPTALKRLWRADRTTLTLLALWLIPALAFNLLIHMTEPGHAIWHLAPLYLLLGIALHARNARRAPRWAAVIAIATILQFAAYPWSETSVGLKRTLDAKAAYLSRAGLQHIDRRALIHTPGDFWRTRAHDFPD